MSYEETEFFLEILTYLNYHAKSMLNFWYAAAGVTQLVSDSLQRPWDGSLPRPPPRDHL